MAKQADDTHTQDMFGQPPRRGRGRPRKPDALTPAERARRYRAKKKAKSQQAGQKQRKSLLSQVLRLKIVEAVRAAFKERWGRDCP